MTRRIAVLLVVMVMGFAAGAYFSSSSPQREPPGAGLDLADVKSTSEKRDDNTSVVSVDGRIRNGTKTRRDVPKVRIAVLDGTGRELRTSTIATSPTVLKPGESAVFHAEISGVADSAARLSITFAGE